MSKQQIDEEGIIREGTLSDEWTDDEPQADPETPEAPIVDDTQPLKGDNKDETPEDDSIPFHKHPRFQQLVEEKNRALEKIAELEILIKPKEEPVMDADIPAEFVELFGDDKDVWDKWQKLNSRQRDEMEKEIIGKIKNQELEEKQKIEKLQKYVDDSLNKLETKGEVFDKNELMKFMIDFEDKYSPLLTKEGNYDFEKGLELMKQLKPQQKAEDPTPKKEVAKLLFDKTKATMKDNAAISMRNLRNKSFSTLAEED